MHAERNVDRPELRVPLVTAFGAAFVHRLNPMFREMMLQQSSVKVPPAVFVAEGEDWGLGAGGWGPAFAGRVDHFAQQTDRDMRQRRTLGSVVFA